MSMLDTPAGAAPAISAATPGHASARTRHAATRLPPAWIAAAVLAVLTLAYAPTLASMAAVWFSNDTFLHGVLIAPLAGWLAWRERAALGGLPLRPSVSGFGALALAGLAWMLATLADVDVTRQYAVVAMVPAALWAVFGAAPVRRLAFPLAFLVLMVPFGDAFIPFLIDLTADATVFLLQATGMPVYRDGNTFSIPSGTWSVVEACSGIRYLIASVTLGALYAYLTYRRWTRRLAFIALSVAVPIAANSVRAWMIVMIGHLSDMRLAVGVDHLVYGWLFFGIVMLLLFRIGARWREDGVAAAPRPAAALQRTAAPRALLPAALACMAFLLAWPLLARMALAGGGVPEDIRLAAPPAPPGWQAAALPMRWQPQHAGRPAIVVQAYRAARAGARPVALRIAHYPLQHAGAGPVGYGNRLVPPDDKEWRLLSDTLLAPSVTGAPFTLREARVAGPGERWLVWRWQALPGHAGAGTVDYKLQLALRRLLGRPASGTAFLLVAPLDDGIDAHAAARRDLSALLAQLLPTLTEGCDHGWRR